MSRTFSSRNMQCPAVSRRAQLHSLQGLHIKKDFDSTNSLDELNSMDRKLLTRDLVSSGYGKTAKSNGIVDSVTSNEIHLKYEDGTTDTVTLYGDNDSTVFKTIKFSDNGIVANNGE